MFAVLARDRYHEEETSVFPVRYARSNWRGAPENAEEEPRNMARPLFLFVFHPPEADFVIGPSPYGCAFMISSWIVIETSGTGGA